MVPSFRMQAFYTYTFLFYQVLCGNLNNPPVNCVAEHKDLKLVDAPVSGGVKRASMGTLTVCKTSSLCSASRFQAYCLLIFIVCLLLP